MFSLCSACACAWCVCMCFAFHTCVTVTLLRWRRAQSYHNVNVIDHCQEAFTVLTTYSVEHSCFEARRISCTPGLHFWNANSCIFVQHNRLAYACTTMAVQTKRICSDSKLDNARDKAESFTSEAVATTYDRYFLVSSRSSHAWLLLLDYFGSWTNSLPHCKPSFP